MTNFIPIFPLGIVVYPGEKVNLHIFEPRYVQLINECFSERKPFGIPVIIEQALKDTGTLVRIAEVVKTYDNGEMDISVEGQEVFTILEVIKSIPEKLYSGAIVNYPVNEMVTRYTIMKQILGNVRTMHQLLDISKEFAKADDTLTSYDVAHHAGLSLQQEYEVLELLFESQRLEYIKRHLAKTIPVLQEAKSLVEKVKLNGHFKHLDSSGWG
ncbi:MAG: LON peptidase substrate-binding domain-containing protein [Chitinophagaceae bacterium]|nr:LON peptidase substrate-binding domain-containing protein [Chitinophagaceae bacterium]MCW5925684.1 LON peptidase substrate-binding domain-containing protein [Chitinophagaceae bacterium]